MKKYRIILILVILLSLISYFNYKLYIKLNENKNKTIKASTYVKNEADDFTYSAMLDLLTEEEHMEVLNIDSMSRDKDRVKVAILWNNNLEALYKFMENNSSKLPYKIQGININKGKIIVNIEFMIK